jgi:hypothetical protein
MISQGRGVLACGQHRYPLQCRTMGVRFGNLISQRGGSVRQVTGDIANDGAFGHHLHVHVRNPVAGQS